MDASKYLGLASTSILPLEIFAISFVLLVAVIIVFVDRTDVPHIKSLPSVPGLPMFGSLLQLGNSHPVAYQKLARRYGPVYQVRLGNKRFVVANTFNSIRQLWIQNQSALNSRPVLHTFHDVLSSSQGFTIGTSPWDESCKRRRKAAAVAVNRSAVQSYTPHIDLESSATVRELTELVTSKEVVADIDPYHLFQRLALNMSLTVCYGFRLDPASNGPLLAEIFDVERGISTIRSTSNNWQDFVPALRCFSTRTQTADNLKNRRDVYLDFLMDKLRAKISMGTDKPSIVGNLLNDPEYKLNDGEESVCRDMKQTNIISAEVKSICVSMVAGGLDTTPASILFGIASLSSPEGQQIQERLYNEINDIYPDGDGWQKCLVEDKLKYMTAFCKEVLRFWTVMPSSLPRVNTKDIQWNGATIPAGTTFLMVKPSKTLSRSRAYKIQNAYAADYDDSHFANPTLFSPDRYLDIPEGSGTEHYGYGAGSRMCVGSHLANKELYVVFARMISAFKIQPAANPANRPDLTGPMSCNANPTGLSIEPKPFKLGFTVRNRRQLDEWLEQSQGATSHLAE
ncbi:hypothetical protein LTR10_019453 [Elasticomyces elasticus]|uniref:Phenylacetate 2-hydroxylase n=1 Tax=Exophiala sideris TaxID=1016849 RepID=A0ABR0J2J4_9EURO|nr:hypothetical protein LTR10_019453 [Elasticomyces elasticus]KAK5024069.1 hypothetical protein LTS07_008803 [Exophiala sideris]KAK5029069.1 hypothetical protein LTR13_008940 [Exophiala sideris]KAK5054781.1 hypothetical protein LTR69_008688 [Exophiala sideris]KAK5178892.1 hypothetical protein LTR44_008721 [Eurotiomycetes sp. CCFEE 6388]